MEPLSAIASVINVVQLADRVLRLCGKYAAAVKDAKDEIGRLAHEVEALRIVLESVDEMIKDGVRKTLTPEPLLEELQGIIENCKADLEDLVVQLDSGKERRPMSCLGRRALKWPFKSKDITKIIEALDRYKGTITLALTVAAR
jgi:Fungal N-terminal domain of STAND proteins